jgi:nickel superoxide dismutase
MTRRFIVLDRLLSALEDRLPLPVAEAHCDAPCGVYDPASARIATEAVLSLTKKILALSAPSPSDAAAWSEYQNTFMRYVLIKEEQAQIAKKELLVLWTDYFKPDHLKEVPNLHDLFWKAAKLCSECKQHVSEAKAKALLEAVEEIHQAFWRTKKREVPWYTAA